MHIFIRLSRNRDLARLLRMLELPVAALLIGLDPAVVFHLFEDLPKAVSRGRRSRVRNGD
jgi:hypothetical protein